MAATASPLELTARSTNLESLLRKLESQQARKLDIVTPASALRAEDGHLIISGAAPVLSASGVTDPNGAYRPTTACDQDIATKLKIALPYVRKCRAEALELWDVNVNGWLKRSAEGQKYMIRCSGQLDQRRAVDLDRQSFVAAHAVFVDLPAEADPVHPAKATAAASSLNPMEVHSSGWCCSSDGMGIRRALTLP